VSPTAARRAQRLSETLEIPRGLWTGEPFDYDGEHFRLRPRRRRDRSEDPDPHRWHRQAHHGARRRTRRLVERAHHQLTASTTCASSAGDASASVQQMFVFVPEASVRAKYQSRRAVDSAIRPWSSVGAAR
jgi:hypothetical protein